VPWTIDFTAEFEPEFDALPSAVQDALYQKFVFLEALGPRAGRPHVDTLKGSKHANMKELRLDAANGVWRVAFAFDPERRAVLLAAGDKAGVSEGRFYKRLISLADRRFDAHLKSLRSGR
jgi:hypothetical protein